MVTIGDSEASLGESLRGPLSSVLPQTAGYPVQVEIFEGTRKKRRDASRESWRPALGEIRIRFDGGVVADPSSVASLSERQSIAPSTSQSRALEEETGVSSRRIDLITSLGSAEERPGFDFVALKWFRDLFLPAEALSWAESPSARDEVLRTAIQNGIVLTSKVPNPKAPAFPVTAIRLNRQHPEVVDALGQTDTAASDFQPVPIRGEQLSSTVQRERR